MEENRTGKAVLGIALLAWVGYTAWPKPPALRAPASLPREYSANARPSLTTLAAIELPAPRPRGSVTWTASEATAPQEAPPPMMDADTRNSEWKQAVSYLHGANFAAAGDAFARIAATDRENANALRGIEAARRRQTEMEEGAGGDAGSLRSSLLGDLAADAEEAQESDRADDAVLYGNWYSRISLDGETPELEKVRGIVQWGVGRKTEQTKQPEGETNLTFQVPEESAEQAE